MFIQAVVVLALGGAVFLKGFRNRLPFAVILGITLGIFVL